MEKKVYTFKEVMEILKLSKSPCLALFNKKEFPSFRIGNKWYVSVEELDRWIKAQSDNK